MVTSTKVLQGQVFDLTATNTSSLLAVLFFFFTKDIILSGFCDDRTLTTLITQQTNRKSTDQDECIMIMPTWTAEIKIQTAPSLYSHLDKSVTPLYKAQHGPIPLIQDKSRSGYTTLIWYFLQLYKSKCSFPCVKNLQRLCQSGRHFVCVKQVSFHRLGLEIKLYKLRTGVRTRPDHAYLVTVVWFSKDECSKLNLDIITGLKKQKNPCAITDVSTKGFFLSVTTIKWNISLFHQRHTLSIYSAGVWQQRRVVDPVVHNFLCVCLCMLLLLLWVGNITQFFSFCIYIMFISRSCWKWQYSLSLKQDWVNCSSWCSNVCTVFFFHQAVMSAVSCSCHVLLLSFSDLTVQGQRSTADPTGKGKRSTADSTS